MKKIILLLCSLLFSSIIMAQDTLEQSKKYYNSGQIAEAEVGFKEILKSNPNEPSALEYLGDIAFSRKQYSKAADYFKPLLQINKNNAHYHFKYAGAIGMQAKNNKFKAMFLVDDIKFHFTKAAELDPNYKDARVALVQLYMELPSAFGGSKDKANLYANQLAMLDEKMGKEAKALIESYK